MEQSEKPDPLYVRGFNEGYLLAKHMPELAASLSKSDGASQRLSGIKDGHKQFALEKSKEHHPGRLNKDRFEKTPPSDKTKDVNKAKDKDQEKE